MSILVVMEQRAVQGPPAWSRMSWETLAAGQQLARELGQLLDDWDIVGFLDAAADRDDDFGGGQVHGALRFAEQL